VRRNRKMKKANFVHLYVQSDYELGASLSRIRDDMGRPGELIRKAKEFGMPALAITDSNLSGAVEFYEACGEVGIKPIIGGTVSIEFAFAGDLAINIVLLAKNEGGYANLVRLINLFHLEKIDLDVLTKNSNDLICLLDFMYVRRHGGFSVGLLKLNEAEKIVRCFKRIYKDNLFLCIGRDIILHYMEVEEEMNEIIIKSSKKLSAPLVAVNYCHYVDKEDALAQTVHFIPYLKLAKNVSLVIRAFNSEGNFGLKSPQEMKNLLSDLPESISNTIKISRMCNLKLPLYEKVHLPDFPLPPELNAKEYLKKLCYQGAIKRYGKVSEDINKRLNKELKMIFGMKLENYFLILHDMVQYARRENILIGPGRGSATRTLVNYLLGITGLDPIKYGLYIEGFLNPQKHALPDLDIDCAASWRAKVLDYLGQKYDKENVVQVATFGLKFARDSIREVAYFYRHRLKISSQKVERIARMIPLGRTIENTLAYDSRLKELYRKDEISRKILDLSRKLEGVKSYIQAHATAVVLKPSDRHLPIPLTQTKDGKIITQYDSETLLKLGYFKIDILALNVLDIIQQTLKIIEQKTGEKIKLEDISINDKKTYKLLSNAQTTGVFHFDSKGWKKLLKRLKPENLLHLAVLIGLYRPGPIDSGLLEEFIKRKKGQIKITYKYPSLEPILKETYGLILYQEQVMKIVMELAGFSPVQANTFRQAMGKKIPEELEEQKKLFLRGIKKKDISESKGEEIFKQLERQGGWGLSKAHACAYALIAYWTAYLKANYPKEYMRTLIRSVKDNPERKKEYLTELKRIQKLKP
jgi:DNA polymerase-3 subunit alpha